MKLHELKPASGSKKKNKRLGHGPGSGKGTYAGKGNKGQNARSGGGVRPGYEGGQMPIHRRLPKRGFTNIFKKKVAILNIRDLSRFDDGGEIGENELKSAGLIKGTYDHIKLLGVGEINIPLTIRVHQASEQARNKITAAGGKVEMIS